MKIAIINPGGITNFGERAIMLGTVYQLRSEHPDSEIAVFGYQDLEEEDPRLYKELSNLKVTFFKPIIAGSNKASRIAHAAGLLVFPKLFLSKVNYDFLKEAVVYSKGQESFTQDYGMVHFVDSFLEQLIVSRFNRNITLLGHSIGPVYKYKALTRLVINRFAAIYVRDSRSEKLLREELNYAPSKIVQVKDLAYRAVEEYDLGVKKSPDAHYLLVPNAAICRTANETEQYVNNLKTLIKTLIDKGERVVIGSSVTSSDWNNDYGMCEKLKVSFPAMELRYYKQLHEFLIDVKDARKVISSRLHPLIMATGLGTDVFALSRSHKVKGLLGDLQLETAIVDPFIEINPGKQLKAL